MTFDDYLGRTIRVGDTVSYAALSGRSAQQVEAIVLDIFEHFPSYGDPEIKMQVQPTGRTSRWQQHWGKKWDGITWADVGIKPVRIMACMAVKVP